MSDGIADSAVIPSAERARPLRNARPPVASLVVF
jgi:hypothetical protein